jgi:hypothetical protein
MSYDSHTQQTTITLEVTFTHNPEDEALDFHIEDIIGVIIRAGDEFAEESFDVIKVEVKR